MLATEQQRALDYLARKGSQAPLEGLRRRFVEAMRGLEERIAGIPEERARIRPLPGKWCVQEVVDHLIESHRPVALQLRAVLDGGDPGPAIPAHLLSADPLAASFAAKREGLRAVHDAIAAVLEEAREGEIPATRIPVVMVVKVERDGVPTPVEWQADLDWKAFAQAFRVHTLEHGAQIERILAAI